MSYFDSLSQFQQAQEQISEHTKSMEQEQLQSKANSLQERYEYAEKQLNDIAGFTTSIGAGIHGARKSYLEVKKKFKNLQEKATDLKNKVQQKLNPDSENVGRDNEGGGDSHNNVANGQESDKPAVDNSKEANQQDLQDRVENTEDKGGANNQVKNEPDPNEPDVASQPKGKAPAQPQEDAPQPQQPPVENKAGGRAPNDEGEPAEPELSNPNLTDKPLTEGQQYLQDALKETQSVEVKAPEPSDAPEPVPETRFGSNGAEQISGNAKSNLSDLANQGEEALKMGGDAVDNATDTLVSGAKDIASKVAPKLAEGLEGGVSTALETAGAVADFLGPAGELVGAGIALGSFFHDLFSKKKEDEAETSVQETPTATAGKSGIDITNLAQANVKSNVVGTLV